MPTGKSEKANSATKPLIERGLAGDSIPLFLADLGERPQEHGRLVRFFGVERFLFGGGPIRVSKQKSQKLWKIYLSFVNYQEPNE